MSPRSREREPSGLAPLASEIVSIWEQRRREEARLCTLRLRGDKGTILRVSYVNGHKKYEVTIDGVRAMFDEGYSDRAVTYFVLKEIDNNSLHLHIESGDTSPIRLYSKTIKNKRENEEDYPDDNMLWRVDDLLKIVEAARVPVSAVV